MNELIEDVNRMIGTTLSEGDGLTGALATAFSEGAEFMGDVVRDGSCSVSDIQMAWRNVLRHALPEAFGETSTTKLGSFVIEVM